jgi:bifunctional non-homologous end joining protein LigD
VVQDEQGISDFEALRSAIHKAPHRLVFFAFDLLHLDEKDLRQTALIERRAALRKLIEPDIRSPIQFSDHVDCNGAKFFKAATELGLEGIVSKRAASRYCSGRSRSWLKIKNMVEARPCSSATTGMRTASRGRYSRDCDGFSSSSPARPS